MGRCSRQVIAACTVLLSPDACHFFALSPPYHHHHHHWPHQSSAIRVDFRRTDAMMVDRGWINSKIRTISTDKIRKCTHISEGTREWRVVPAISISPTSALVHLHARHGYHSWAQLPTWVDSSDALLTRAETVDALTSFSTSSSQPKGDGWVDSPVQSRSSSIRSSVSDPSIHPAHSPVVEPTACPSISLAIHRYVHTFQKSLLPLDEKWGKDE